MSLCLLQLNTRKQRLVFFSDSLSAHCSLTVYMHCSNQVTVILHSSVYAADKWLTDLNYMMYEMLPHPLELKEQQLLFTARTEFNNLN